MRLSEFKKDLIFKFKLFKVNTRYSAYETFAYALNNYGGLASTIFYMLTYLVFLKAIFGHVDTIAGYNYSEILFFTFVSQINYFVLWGFSTTNIENLYQIIRNGDLDLILIRPVPHLWFVTFRRVDISMIFFHAIPSIAPLVYLLIKNFGFIFDPWNVVAGVYSAAVGLVLIHCFQFVINSFTFWTEQGKNLFKLSCELNNSGEAIPFEGYPTVLRIIGLTVIPNLIHTTVTVSILLGKTAYVVPIVLYSTVVMIIFLKLKSYVWERGLKRYSSASS